jgi:hypothetical protein
MALREIAIHVSDAAARTYESASPQERHKLDALLTLRLTEATQRPASLEEVMDDLGRKARERGLTQEALDEILNTDD